jgi:hypothetical protein
MPRMWRHAPFISRSLASWSLLAVPAVLVALVLALTAPAAPPPEAKPPEPPEAVAPPPLAGFNLVPNTPASLALLVWGSPFAPQTGSWCLTSGLMAGTHPDVNVWDLRGALSTRPGRNQVGAATLFLSGFGPHAGAPLVELATLRAGDDEMIGCWTLIDTDKVRPFPAVYLQDGWIRDKKGIYVGQLEIEAFNQVVVLAYYTSEKAFARAARHDITYATLYNEPERNRGKVVHFNGRLKKVSRLDPPDEARAAGVTDMYEAWVFTDAYGENPICAVFTVLPPGMKVDNEQKYNLDVSFDGYFYKRYRYKAGDTKKANEFRDAPLLIGHTLNVPVQNLASQPDEAADNWGQHLIWVFVGLVGIAVAVVGGLTYWFRFSDQRIRRRLNRVRDRGFIPPAPDEVMTEENVN